MPLPHSSGTPPPPMSLTALSRLTTPIQRAVHACIDTSARYCCVIGARYDGKKGVWGGGREGKHTHYTQEIWSCFMDMYSRGQSESYHRLSWNVIFRATRNNSQPTGPCSCFLPLSFSFQWLHSPRHSVSCSGQSARPGLPRGPRGHCGESRC